VQGRINEELEASQNIIKNHIGDACGRLNIQIRDEFAATVKELHAKSQMEQRLQSDLRDLREKLAQSEIEFVKVEADLEYERSHRASPTALLENIRDIERHGYVKINVGTGDVEVLRGLDFKPRKSTDEPTAEFINNIEGEAALHDIVALYKMFEVQMTIVGHTKGGESGFWEALSLNRAKHVVEKLARQGVSTEHMVSKGSPGKRGLNRGCVVIHLDIYPDHD